MSAAGDRADASPQAPRYSLWQLVRYMLALGTWGFGGPVALVGYMYRDLVEQRQWMTESVITIDPETTVEEAAKMMFEKNFRHLPVCKDGRLLGIVSLRRLSQYEFEHSKESVGPAH